MRGVSQSAPPVGEAGGQPGGSPPVGEERAGKSERGEVGGARWDPLGIRGEARVKAQGAVLPGAGSREPAKAALSLGSGKAARGG